MCYGLFTCNDVVNRIFVLMRLILLLFLIHTYTHAQFENRALGYFTLDVGSSSVVLSWELNAGFTCNGISVERRLDEEDRFETVGVIKGICGSPTQAIPYTFIDTLVTQNKTHYYRLVLGAEGLTMTRSAFVRSLGAPRVKAYPIPAHNQLTINLHKPPAGAVRIALVAIDGRVVYERQWIAMTDHQVYVGGFPAGRYVLLVEGEGVQEITQVIVK